MIAWLANQAMTNQISAPPRATGISDGNEADRVGDALADGRVVEGRDDQREGEADEEQQERKAGEQEQRLQPVVPDVGPEAVGAEHDWLTAARGRAPSGTSPIGMVASEASG